MNTTPYVWVLIVVISDYANLTITNEITATHDDMLSPFERALEFMKDKGTFLIDAIGSYGGLDSRLDDDNIQDIYHLEEMLDDDNTSTPVCAACKAAVAGLKAIVAASNDWEDVRDLVVDLCFQLFENVTDVRADVLCPGTIDLQGPHVYEVLRPEYGRSPEDTCRNLNICFPPKEEVEKKLPTRSRKIQSKKSLTERKKAAVVVVQLADIHIEPKYVEGTETDCGLPVCCDPVYGPGDAGRYGDFSCNIPQRTMELFLRKTAELQPEFVIYSGDTPPHSFWDETMDTHLNCTGILIQSLARYLGDYNVYPNIGNHEMYPTNLYSMEYLRNYTEPMNVEFTNWWSDFADFSYENIETMLTGGYYSLVARPGLRIISFNTNYWYTFNWYNVLHEGGSEIQAMMDFMRTSFEAARENNEKVVLVGHHPPNSGDALVVYTRALEGLMAEYGDLVTMHVAGHTHNDEFRVLSIDGQAISTVWVAPPVTGLGKDPSMRVFYIDSETLEVLDYERHGFYMADSIENPEEPTIEVMYSAVEAYGLDDMSPASWRDMTDRMQTDDGLLQTYYRNYVARPTNSTCDEACMLNHVCKSQYYSYDDNVSCEREALPGFYNE